MVRCKTPVYAPRPKYMERRTDIRAPSVRTDWVNGRARYTFIPPEVGPIKILDTDDEDEQKPKLYRSITPRIKREHSDSPRVLEQSQSRGRNPHIKQDPSVSSIKDHLTSGSSKSPTNVDRRRQPQGVVQSHEIMIRADSGGESSSATVHSSESSDSDNELGLPSNALDSENEDGPYPSEDSDSDIYTPSTSLSRISSTSPITRRQGVQQDPDRMGPRTATEEQTVAEQDERSEYPPLEFYIDLPMRLAQCRSRKGKSPMSQALPQEASSPQVSSYDGVMIDK